jgi:hypothetical protein
MIWTTRQVISACTVVDGGYNMIQTEIQTDGMGARYTRELLGPGMRYTSSDVVEMSVGDEHVAAAHRLADDRSAVCS